MPGKFILALSSLVFIAYGTVSLINPEVPAGFAGLVLTNGNAYAEIGSMYGGLQTGIGLYCLLALFSSEYYRGGLAVLVIGIGMLAIARLISALTTSDPLTMYTWGALMYEAVTVVIATVALRQSYSGATKA
ncbi:MAG: hypothetical protein CMQ46_08880 [Gammaproteobacteria bacterium]|nr:hypothetical protein [Gammaproteobacteria bacterium]MBJ55360.1 hypothetical protein [Gammaproteobacteria bacterium]|tara:strand:- start:1134 stop:1529 length:396 start_codon:yes stop_codon:yes gene_type:complete